MQSNTTVFDFDDSTIERYRSFWSPQPPSLSPEISWPTVNCTNTNQTCFSSAAEHFSSRRMPQLESQFNNSHWTAVPTSTPLIHAPSAFPFPPAHDYCLQSPPHTAPAIFQQSTGSLQVKEEIDQLFDFLDEDVFCSKPSTSTVPQYYYASNRYQTQLSNTSSGYASESQMGQNGGVTFVSPSSSFPEYNSPLDSISTSFSSAHNSFSTISSTSPQSSLIDLEESKVLDSVLDIMEEFESRHETTLSNTTKIRSEKMEKICVVCSKSAKGYNFGVVTCECCKAFFRRNARLPENRRPVCQFKRDCPTMPHGRKNSQYCSACRLDRCFQKGMKKELILSDEERILRREKTVKNRIKREEKNEKKINLPDHNKCDRKKKVYKPRKRAGAEVSCTNGSLTTSYQPLPSQQTHSDHYVDLQEGVPDLSTVLQQPATFRSTAMVTFQRELSVLRQQLESYLLQGLRQEQIETLFIQTHVSQLILLTSLSMTSDSVAQHQQPIIALHHQLQNHPELGHLLQTVCTELQDLNYNLTSQGTLAQHASFMILFGHLQHQIPNKAASEFFNRWVMHLSSYISPVSGNSLDNFVSRLSNLSVNLANIAKRTF